MMEDGLVYDPKFLSKSENESLTSWLCSLHPLWEERHGSKRGNREGQRGRRLLRPVYWLGGWQFACLNYFHPPNYVIDRVMEAEPFPPLLAGLTKRMEDIAHATYRKEDLPEGWKLNTCLINYYGLTKINDHWVDTARVGGHRDYEPGPTGSLSVGSPGLFQFATQPRGPEEEDVVVEQWLANGSMMLFGTPKFKDELYHRVPRIRRRNVREFDMKIPDFRVLRINITLRYVPDEWITPFSALKSDTKTDIRSYMETLSEFAPFFASALSAEDHKEPMSGSAGQ